MARCGVWCSCPLVRRAFVVLIYSLVVVVQLLLWPSCEDGDSYSLVDDLAIETDYILPDMPFNVLDPPMWNMDTTTTGQCGTWQKQYTKLHRAITSGNMPPSYFVYTTGNGFPPIIESVPHALKGIGTAFMLAILTDRAFIIDWNSPSGFDKLIFPRYINWKPDSTNVGTSFTTDHVHDIGSSKWFKEQNLSVDWYMSTNFDEYFSHEVETVQSLSYDFTYAILRNNHYRHKIKNLGLHTAKCRLCCMWHYLFRFTELFNHNLAIYTKNKLRVPPKSDIIFINLSFQQKYLPYTTMLRYATKTMKCVEKVSKHFRNSVWIVASNNYRLLDSIPEMFPKVKKAHGVFYSEERYTIDLLREINSPQSQHNFMIPRMEHNALMYYFIGLQLQLKSAILFSSQHSIYSETMAAVRHFYHPSGKYLVYPDRGCHLQHFGASS